jgi:hypothetical protein
MKDATLPRTHLESRLSVFRRQTNGKVTCTFRAETKTCICSYCLSRKEGNIDQCMSPGTRTVRNGRMAGRRASNSRCRGRSTSHNTAPGSRPGIRQLRSGYFAVPESINTIRFGDGDAPNFRKVRGDVHLRMGQDQRHYVSFGEGINEKRSF